jgi:hypothetical protein
MDSMDGSFVSGLGITADARICLTGKQEQLHAGVSA